MTVVRFHGVIDYDEYGNPETVRIGDVDVIEAVEDAFGWHGSQVTVALADERFHGDLHVDPGSTGYSEWTPGEAAALIVGEHDVLRRLADLSGQTVTMWVANEPVNVLSGGG